MSMISLFTELNQPACFHCGFGFRPLLEKCGADSTAQSPWSLSGMASCTGLRGWGDKTKMRKPVRKFFVSA